MTCKTCNDRGVYRVYVTHFEWFGPGASRPPTIRGSDLQLALCPDCPPEETVPGSVACGLAYDLGAEQMRTAAFGPLLDVLNANGGQASVIAVELARALGLYDSRERHLAGINDDELLAECRRRGWHPEMGLAPRYGRSPMENPAVAGELRQLWDLLASAELEGQATATEVIERDHERSLARQRIEQLLNPPMTLPAGVDLAPGPDETVLLQYGPGNVPRNVVRIRNIGPGPGALAGIAADQIIIDEVSSFPGPPDPGMRCSDRRCSRYATPHPGRPCDTRRARGIAGKR